MAGNGSTAKFGRCASNPALPPCSDKATNTFGMRSICGLASTISIGTSTARFGAESGARREHPAAKPPGEKDQQRGSGSRGHACGQLRLAKNLLRDHGLPIEHDGLFKLALAKDRGGEPFVPFHHLRGGLRVKGLIGVDQRQVPETPPEHDAANGKEGEELGAYRHQYGLDGMKIS